MSGVEFRRIRQRVLHLTQEQLAEILDIEVRTIQRWERAESVPENRRVAPARLPDLPGQQKARGLGGCGPGNRKPGSHSKSCLGW